MQSLNTHTVYAKLQLKYMYWLYRSRFNNLRIKPFRGVCNVHIYMQLLKCKAILFSPWLINNCHNKKGFLWTQIDRTKHNRLGMRHLRLIYLPLDADSCQRNVYNPVRPAINLIQQSMSLSISFVSLHTHTQKPPTFLSKESHITCMQV